MKFIPPAPRRTRIKDGFLELECRTCLKFKVATEFRQLSRDESFDDPEQRRVTTKRSQRCGECERLKWRINKR